MAVDKDVQLGIYKYYVGSFTIGAATLSPIPANKRGKVDRNASFSIYQTDLGNYRWKDHGSMGSLSGDAVDLICLMEDIDNCDFHIAMDFYSNVIYSSDISNIRVDEPDKLNKDPIVYYDYNFTSSELSYIKRYKFTRGQLIRRGIYGCRGLDWGNGEVRFKSSAKYPKFIYKLSSGEVGESFKIYNPLSQERRHKWKSHNIKDTILEGYHTLPSYSNTLIIASSTKDSLCLECLKMGIVSRSPTSEGAISNLINAQDELNKRFNNIYIIFDNDSKGIEASRELARFTNWNILPFPFPPEIKDIAEVVENKKYGYYYLKNNLHI